MLTRFRKKKKRSSRSNLFFSVLLGLLVLLVIGFLVVTDWKIRQRRAELSAKLSALEEEVAAMEQKNRELKENISEAGSEEYLERAALEQLGLKPFGTEVVVITEEEAEKEKEPEQEEKSWWEKIKGIWEP